MIFIVGITFGVFETTEHPDIHTRAGGGVNFLTHHRVKYRFARIFGSPDTCITGLAAMLDMDRNRQYVVGSLYYRYWTGCPD